ncbi:MAG: LamG-like jellyroll fold domain-containing protein, partial [Patescibacteria group bacterium]
PEPQPEPETEIVDNLLISKIYSTLKDDYIEIYNPNDFDVDLSSYRLYKTKTSESPSILIRFGNELDASYPGGLLIPAKGKYLIARLDASDEIKSIVQAIVNRSEFTFTGSGYTIYLSKGVVSSDDDEDIIDKVGYGEATYYYNSPALEIPDNHLLIRKANSSSTPVLMAKNCDHYDLGHSYNTYNNYNDFVLLDLTKLEGDYCNSYGSVIEDDSNEEFSNNFCVDGGVGISSLINLWHFDECKGNIAYDFAGSNNMPIINVSRIESENKCAIMQGDRNNIITTDISPLFDPNKFTLIFNYKIFYTNSRPNIKFHNSINSNYFQIQLFPHYTEFRNFPNAPSRMVDLKWLNDNKWHQFALVVDKDLDYWALYRDGVEVLRSKVGLGFFADVDKLSIIPTGEVVGFDEVSIFSQPLKEDEILRIYENNYIFNTIDCADRRFKSPKLISYFNFDDNSAIDLGEGSSVFNDLVSSSSSRFYVDNKNIFFNKNNFYVGIDSESNFLSESNFSANEEQIDMSVSFWIKNEKSSSQGVNLNYFYLSIMEKGKDVFGVSLLNNFNYYFNGLKLEVDESDFYLPLLDGTWHNLTMVYDSYNFKLNIYIDGVLQRSVVKDWLTFKVLDSFSIISNNSISYIDEVSIWSGVVDSVNALDLFESKKDLF